MALASLPGIAGLQKSESIGPLVERRLRECSYIRETYGGSRHWLTLVALGPGVPKDDGLDDAQVLRWYYLGVSLATLLPHPPGGPFLRAALQLLEEHQYHFSSTAERLGSKIRARAPGGGGGGSEEESYAPSLNRANGKVLYEYLLTPHVAHALSGVQIALSLCEQLSRVYRKLAECPAVEAAGATLALCEAVYRVDERLDEAFLAPAAKHCDALAKGALCQSLGRLDPLFGVVSGYADTMERTTEGGAAAPAVAGAL